MLVLHHLEFSRSSRILWLLEALGLEYELVVHKRGPDGRAQADLGEAHGLGKAPALIDGDLALVESAAILRYLAGRPGGERFVPPAGTPAHALHDQWLDYAEGSLMPPLLLKLLGLGAGGLPPALERFASGEYARAARFVGDAVAGDGFLLGASPMLADIQLSYCLALAEAGGFLADHPALQRYWRRLQAEPGFQRMIAVGGPMVRPFPQPNAG